MINDIRFSSSDLLEMEGKRTIRVGFMETYQNNDGIAYIMGASELLTLLISKVANPEAMVTISVIGLVHETEHKVIRKIVSEDASRALDNVFRTDIFLTDTMTTITTSFYTNK